MQGSTTQPQAQFFFLLWPLTDGKFANLGTMKKHTLTSCSSISPPMRRSIQSARGTQIIRGGQTSRLPGGQEVEDRFAPWKSYPLSGHWRRPQLLRSTFRSAPESCPCCVSPTMRCGRLPSRSDVNTCSWEGGLAWYACRNAKHTYVNVWTRRFQFFKGPLFTWICASNINQWQREKKLESFWVWIVSHNPVSSCFHI